MPRDEVWALYGPERQRAQEAQAKAELHRRLCTACKVEQNDRAQQQEKARAHGREDELRGIHWTFETPEGVTDGR